MQSFFSRFIIIRSYKEPRPQKPQMASHHWSKTTWTKPQRPDSRPQPQNRNPQTTINEQKRERNIKNSPGKNIASWICSIREYNIGWYIIIFGSIAMNLEICDWSIMKTFSHLYTCSSPIIEEQSHLQRIRALRGRKKQAINTKY